MTESKQRTKERDRIVSAACEEGRFSRGRVAHYSKLYDADPEGTRVLLTADEKDGGLARGVPSSARGATGLKPREEALFAASRAQMNGEHRRARDIMAAAPADPYPVTVPAASGPRDDGMYSLGSAPAPASSVSSSIPANAKVEVDAGGHMSFAGLPVSIGEDGIPKVNTSVGAMNVETFRSLDLDLDLERGLYASRVSMGRA